MFVAQFFQLGMFALVLSSVTSEHVVYVESFMRQKEDFW